MSEHPEIHRHVDELEDETWPGVPGGTVWRGLFSQETTRTQSLCSGVARVPVGGVWPDHRHEAPEVYFVIAGRGTVRVGEAFVSVSAGSAVHVPSWAVHGVRNEGAEDLRFFYVFDAASQQDVEYDFGPFQAPAVGPASG